MSHQVLNAIQQVLVEAMESPHFFDLSDAERLNWMIERAYELGRAVESPNATRQARSQERSSCSPKRPTSA